MAHMSAMMDLHARMMPDPVIRQRVMADSVMRRLMTQMMDSAEAAHREHMGGAARKPGAQEPPGAKKHEGHGGQMREPPGRNRPRAEPSAPAPRPAKPDSSDMPPHDQHSAGAAEAPVAGTPIRRTVGCCLIAPTSAGRVPISSYVARSVTN